MDGSSPIGPDAYPPGVSGGAMAPVWVIDLPMGVIRPEDIIDEPFISDPCDDECPIFCENDPIPAPLPLPLPPPPVLFIVWFSVSRDPGRGRLRCAWRVREFSIFRRSMCCFRMPFAEDSTS